MSTTTSDITVNEFDRILELHPITAKYSGRPGCACGCNGTHTACPTPRQVNVTAAIIRRHIREGTANVFFSPCNGFDGHVWAETDTRVNALYFTP